MSKFDIVYDNLVKKILIDGVWDKGQAVRPVWADGTPAYTQAIVHQEITIDGTEVPLLTKKKVAWKTAIHELIWFYIKRTSDVSYLRENNVKIWEEWTREPSKGWEYPNIGRAYGYQLGKPIRTGEWNTHKGYIHTNQVHSLIDGIIKTPYSRRHLISLWNIDDLWDMVLKPCVWSNQWVVQEEALHGVVTIRSNDMGLGHPFNVFQYYVLQRMIGHVTDKKIGTLTFSITNPHIYERHVDPLREQISREAFDAPKLWLNPEVKNFDDFTIDDFLLVDPSLSDELIESLTREEALRHEFYEHGEKLRMEVAE